MALMGANAQICALAQQLLFRCNNAMVRSIGRKLHFGRRQPAIRSDCDLT